MQQNIPLAIVIQAFGSFCFALSAYLQHTAVGVTTSGNSEKARMDAKSLLASIKRPKWILGLLLMGVSLACQVGALFMAPVSVVQPMGILAFPYSILLQAWAHKRKPESQVVSAVLATVAATFGFVVMSSLYAAGDSEFSVLRVMLGAVTIYAGAAGLGFLGSRGPNRWRCLFWASGGAFFYGLEAALAKSLIEFSRQADWARDPVFWFILVILVVGSATAGWMVQQGYATGPAEIVVASMTITSPVVAVLYGMAVLGEGANLTAFAGFMMFLLGGGAVLGVIRLTQLNAASEEAALAAPQPDPARPAGATRVPRDNETLPDAEPPR